MFSTLAKYLFGGFGDGTPETTPMQYATREVNDWLLVDMPDQDIDNEDLNSEGEEDDEILTALPLLMTQESYICDNSYDEIHMPLETNRSLDTQIATQSSLLNECIEDFQILPESMYVNQLLYYPSDHTLATSQRQNNFYCTTMRQLNPYFLQSENIRRDYKPRRKNTRSSSSSTYPCVRESRDDIEVLLKYINESQRIKQRAAFVNCSDRINHPAVFIDFADGIKHPAAFINCSDRIKHPAAYSKKFINHRSPTLPPKTALFEQISELKPVQRGIENDAKKFLTRSQMNRQNRNYIYESSVKTNRRRHLQRNHSGANNNRKC